MRKIRGPNPPRPFAETFLIARLDRELNLRQLANETGFTPAFIRWYEENAKNPTAQTMVKYAAALNLRFTIDATGIHITDLRTEVTTHVAPGPAREI